MNTVTVTMGFEIGLCNGSMHIDIADQSSNILSLNNLTETTHSITFNTEWPNRLTLTLSNKDMRRDTQIDKEGNIVADKYVKLIYMSVNGFKLSQSALYKICQYVISGQEATNEVYWGFQGKVIIDFDKPTPTRWNFHLNNVLFFRNNNQ
jgi:hypothetical protein